VPWHPWALQGLVSGLLDPFQGDPAHQQAVLIAAIQPLRWDDPKAASLVVQFCLQQGLCCIGRFDQLDAVSERVAEEDGKTHRSAETSPLL
jgi:hypothetical protein